MVFRIISIFFVSALLLAKAGYAQLTTFQWVQQPIGVAMSCIASDGRGNCYAAGDNGFVTRYTPSGIASWAIHIAGLINGSATAITLGPKGEIYVAGYMYDSTIYEDPIGSLADRMFLARLDTSGSLIWLVRSQNISNASATAIAVSRSGGSVYLVGTETGAIGFGGISLGSSANASIFVGRFNANGNAVWLQRSYDQAKYYNMSEGFSCADDDSENVYIGGQFSDTINFEGIHDSAGSSTEAIIISLDSSGKTRWLKNFGANASIQAMCYIDGFIFATGSTNMVMRLKIDGSIDKVLQNSGAPIESQLIASDGAGFIMISGYFNGSLSVGSVKISHSVASFYMLKLDTGLLPIWATYAEVSRGGKPAISLDSLGHDYLCGNSGTSEAGVGSFIIPVETSFLAQLDECTITCPLIRQGPLCSGDTLEIPVHVVGAFPNVNTFTAQISDSLGRWQGAQSIGAITASKINTIRSVIPSKLHSGSKYRIRVTASDPGVVGLDNGYDLSLRASPDASVTPSGPIDLCEDDSLTLTASGGEHYLWSTGDTTAQIVIGASGDYSVFATGNDGCGILLPSAQVITRPSPPVPPITRSGNTLFGNLSGFENQWYLNRSVIPGATGPNLHITYNGTYNLTVSSTYHCSSTSDDFVVGDLSTSGVKRSTDNFAGLTLSSNPASETVTASFSLSFPEHVRLFVVDLAGLKVLTTNDLTYPAGTSSLSIDVGRLPSGTYFVELHTDEAVETRRLVVER